MAMTQEHTQASNDKQKEVFAKEEFIPPTIRYRQSFCHSENGSTVGVYSLRLTSATTSSVESFRTAFTSLQEDEGKGENGDEDARSEESSICEGQYANQPRDVTLDASHVVEDVPLPRLGLDLSPTEVQTSGTRSQSSMNNPTKDTEPSNRMHRIHKRITKNFSRKLTKRKEH
ncbi:hypothetical protein CEP54_014383 [Fusarium duplospermum]|uniref:Uncharacterized protein n=1 Tax=Fusarium duplospermum TaxID=1325734 RepID=A0A428NWM2_9HYPO|nr:hypothetical protein CEP54_014383 [Fusarium duplospermum]